MIISGIKKKGTTMAGCLLLFFLITNCQSPRKEKDPTKEEQEQPQPSSKEPEKASEETTSDAKQLYLDNCGSCHQSNGGGVPNMYPPLSKTSWVTGDKERLINVVLNGLSQKIEVQGKTYQNTMPPQNHLSDQKIATILTYIRKNFGNDASEITKEEVTEVRGN